jgi:hypothetical protein
MPLHSEILAITTETYILPWNSVAAGLSFLWPTWGHLSSEKRKPSLRLLRVNAYTYTSRQCMECCILDVIRSVPSRRLKCAGYLQGHKEKYAEFWFGNVFGSAHLEEPEEDLRITLRLKMAVFWVVTLCSLVEVYRRFGGACCLHHQGDEPQQPRRQPSSCLPPWEPQISRHWYWS